MSDNDIPSIGQVLLTEDGIVLVLHILICEACFSFGEVYIDMSCINERDKVCGIVCPVCKGERLALATYKILDEIRQEGLDNEDQDNSYNI